MSEAFEIAVPEEGRAVAEAVLTRRSVRGFLDRPVSHDTVEATLTLAARAPSGSNIQPWKVYVCAGEAKDKLSRDLLAAHNAGGGGHTEQYDYYPNVCGKPYLSRRRKLGWDLYGLIGIGKGDKEQMARQLGRNYEFFGAPVGMIFTLERYPKVGSRLDTGMFLQTVMISARAFGLDTCSQQAFAKFHRIIRANLGIPANEIVVCGMSLGYADTEEPANQLKTERMAIRQFARFKGF